MHYCSRDRALFTVGAGLLSGGALYLWWKWYSKKEKIPTEWRKVGVLNDLMCFPIKSCGVVRLNTMECDQMGLKSGLLRDRDFMIINTSNNFVSARIHPRLVLIKPTVNGDVLSLEAPEMDKISIKFQNNIGAKRKVTLWSHTLEGIDYGDEVAEWISRFILNEPVGLRLVQYPQDNKSMKRSRYRSLVTDDDSGAYPDLSSFCIMNESSINDLNERLKEKDYVAKPQDFRPNFLVKGATALEEDNWKWVKIGDVIFKAVKHCTRCVLTTVDSATGIKSASGEPLAMLKTYRMIGEPSPAMGVHLAVRGQGKIQMGDPVYVA